jgi:GDPmannose 4,6-dehydratase
MAKTALIAGVTGQDGSYLAHYLLNLGYRVVGTSRDAQVANVSRLKRLGVAEDVQLTSLALNDFRSVLKVVVSVQPDEIYNLAGQTSVGLSFEQPVECIDSIFLATLNLLEVIRFLGSETRFINAGSSECFGDTGRNPATEQTAMKPNSPYAVAKASAYWQVASYRNAYGMFACTALLSNHESPLRPNRFVTQKIIDGVRAIKAGKQRTIKLGNMDVWRDWGWAPEYVQAMHLMLQSKRAFDYVIASGCTSSLYEFARLVFLSADLEIEGHLESVEALMRPADLRYSSLDPTLVKSDLGWESKLTLGEIAQKMYNNDLF